jgi:phosphonate transport system ATP-binding protein
VIRLERVSMTYPGGVTALEPVSLGFERGKFNVLLGPSGAGKSTLLRCINLLNRPTGGRVTVEGIGELRDRATVREHRRRTGMIYQQHQLIGRLSALKNALAGRLGYHSALRSVLPLPEKDQRIALEALERVGLLDKALTRVDNLSGGQQQRVGIARALAQQPKVLLADEPVASLDPAASERVLSLLHRICKEDGLCAVVSLHQVELAKRYADRLVGLADGAVVFDGGPAELTDEHLAKIYDGANEEEEDAAGDVRQHQDSFINATTEERR